jgi:hypothetical protein
MPVTTSLRSRAGSEPLRFAEGKLREGAGSPGDEILRCAQDDSQALRMTARTPLTSAHGKPSLQMSRQRVLWLLISEFQATIHDEAHDAFMTLSPYTRTKEGEAHHLSSGTKFCWLGL